MQKYIGVEIVEAEPMTLGMFHNYKNTVIEPGKDPMKDGYLVKYENSYTSWCPKQEFEAANRPTNAMPFGHAIEAMKRGEKVARAGWNGKDMFIYHVPGQVYKTTTITGRAAFGEDKLCGSYICMKPAAGPLVIGWLASQTDMLADDWMIA